MTAKPPRASTKSDAKSDAKRPKRAATQGGKLRSSSVGPTDQFLRITDDEIVEVMDATGRQMPALPPLPASIAAGPAEQLALRLLVLESATHLAGAQEAITAAGHVVVRGAAGTAGIDKLRPLIGEVDAIVLALPGGEPLLDAVLALGARRPIVIGSITASAVAAARRAASVAADLFVVRPHDVERLAPVLYAAGKLVEQRRQLASGTGFGAAAPEGPEDADVDVDVDLDDALSDLDAEQSGGALQPLQILEAAAGRELERSQRFGYPLSLAVFSLEIAPPAPPATLRGILRARTGNALVNAVRDVDIVAELDADRFVVLLPYTDRLAGADVARRIIGSVAAADPINAGGRSYPPKVIGAVVGLLASATGQPPSFDQLLRDATQLLESAQVTGASLAVEQ